MPSSKSGGGATTMSHRHNKEKNRRGRLAERSMSFHGGEGRISTEDTAALPRPRTVPELIRRGGGGGGEIVSPPSKKKLTRILVKVAVLRSIGSLNVVVPMESTVEDLIAAVVGQYVKECRRPVLDSCEPRKFDLHYSQFSLESLDRNDKLIDLGSRNFFLCPKMAVEGGGPPASASAASTSGCSKEAEKDTKKGLTWLKFLDFSR